MDLLLQTPGFALVMFAGMLGAYQWGRLLRARQAGTRAEAAASDAMEAAVFALLGLLLAFTFSGAMSRFDHRRELITQEANAIGTAYLRIDLLPLDSQPALRALFRDYVKERLATYQDLTTGELDQGHYERSLVLQGEIWTQMTRVTLERAPPPVIGVVVPALNEMIDLTTTRWAVTQAHPPRAIFLMLLGVGLVASLLVGYRVSPGGRWISLHAVAFVAVIAATVYVITDIEYPRQGLVRVDSSDQLLQTVLDSMK